MGQKHSVAGDKFGDNKLWCTGASQWLSLVVILDKAQMKGEALASVAVVVLEWWKQCNFKNCGSIYILSMILDTLIKKKRGQLKIANYQLWYMLWKWKCIFRNFLWWKIWLISYSQRWGHTEKHAQDFIIRFTELQRRLNALPQSTSLLDQSPQRAGSKHLGMGHLGRWVCKFGMFRIFLILSLARGSLSLDRRKQPLLTSNSNRIWPEESALVGWRLSSSISPCSPSMPWY